MVDMHDELKLQPSPPAPKRTSASWGWPIAALVFLLSKFKFAAFLLLSKFKLIFLALQALNFTAIVTTLSTMALSAWVYAQRFGALFAIGFVVLILIHELGHGYAARRLGLKVGAPIFIPFFGALITLKEQLRTPWINCVVGFGGPFAGMVGTVVCLLLADLEIFPQYTQLLYGLAHFSFVINLFNLIPIFGLDGDRISAPLSGGQLLTVVVLALGIYGWCKGEFEWSAPNLLIIAALCLCKGIYRLKYPEPTGYIENVITVPERRDAFLGYLGLLASLSILSAYSSVHVYGS